MPSTGDQRRPVGRWIGWIVLLVALFVQPLARLAVHAFHTDLHSHVLLVPLIAGYLLYSHRASLPAPGAQSIGGSVVLGVIGMGALAAAIAWRDGLSLNDHLALTTLAFVSLVAAGGFFFLGREWMAAAAFPIGFLIFMVPLPDVAVVWFEEALVLASAEATAMYFGIAGTPLVRTGTVFELPGVVLRVAQECSGIRSTWVLFITSILASHLFLRSTWRRVLLVAFVIPLGILRNGFRVFVLGLLAVHVGPHILDTAIHHQGGPIFFVMSLVPLFLLLWWLRRGETHKPVQSG